MKEGQNMRATLFFASGLMIVLEVAVVILLFYKNYLLKKQIKHLGKADMWRKLAYTDDLTGAKNRTAYHEHIEKLKNKRRGLFGIVLFDIDNFKRINDTKGHLAGDRVLKVVAKALLESFDKSNYSVYRIGGDEFAVIAENADEREIIELLIELREELETKEMIRLSKGYAFVEDNVDEAFRQADEMLYVDKKSKK